MGTVEPASGARELVPAAGIRVVPDGEWDALVAGLGGLDSYTRLAYHRVSALLEPAGTRPVLLHHPDGEVALPLLLRPLPDGSGWDATSAYGYGGPVAAAARGAPSSRATAFGAALDGWARRNGVVTTFLRLHPLLGNAPHVPPTGELVELGATVSWDVAAGRDLVAALHPHHRRAARKADRAGLVVAVAPGPAALAEFRALYDTTMRRQQADPFFFFPDAYWDALAADREALGLVLVEGRLEGELVAALLCFAEGPRLHYHLGASADAARAVGASNRCFLAAAQWAQARGMTRFHLGGGVGGSAESPLFVFKHRYDPAAAPLPFHVAKLVHDPDRYRSLAGTDSTAGFFPPWRRGR
ncbi:GNAT family N-acetyltransferase [Geodermatophilus ruber]|uniref:Acetyltransferase (GNAT) domain-containing protein n=1 Tax=Geodermatophilus ruber TaxID=504800 RepID=A0A1I4DJ41_9ACTN|nr:GNAT family N-acetyltransferase [Geodermatophilus ruber]SFK91911.1 Acetyltransferase (GNAT) domain-containing protein [Geodermatophilus ruber]